MDMWMSNAGATARVQRLSGNTIIRFSLSAKGHAHGNHSDSDPLLVQCIIIHASLLQEFSGKVMIYLTKIMFSCLEGATHAASVSYIRVYLAVIIRSEYV